MPLKWRIEKKFPVCFSLWIHTRKIKLNSAVIPHPTFSGASLFVSNSTNLFWGKQEIFPLCKTGESRDPFMQMRQGMKTAAARLQVGVLWTGRLNCLISKVTALVFMEPLDRWEDMWIFKQCIRIIQKSTQLAWHAHEKNSQHWSYVFKFYLGQIIILSNVM